MENRMPSAADGNWTKYQEKTLQESLSTIKPGVNFWRLVAERVPAKGAKDCFEKFYSERTVTRGAKRSREFAELGFALTERSGGKRVKSLHSNAPATVKTPAREKRATRQAASGPAKIDSDLFGRGSNTPNRTQSKFVKPLDVKTPAQETRATRQTAPGPAKIDSKPSGKGSNTPNRTRSKFVKPLDVKTPAQETRATRQTAPGPPKVDSKPSGKGSNTPNRTRSKFVKPLDAKTPARETRATRQATAGPAQIDRKTESAGTKGTKRRIEAASSSPDVKRIKATKPEGKAFGGTLGQRARKGSKNRTGKQDLMENRARASVLDRSSDADDGSDSASLDDDLWTQEQEMALQNAYATIKPSADFWRLISKRVPGRSADECFNKFYSAHPTPPRAPQRSCLKDVDCPPSLPRVNRGKGTGGKRLLEVHRTVRNILRKQQVDDGDYKTDAFAALEPPDVVHNVMDGVSAMSNESTENVTRECLQSNKENRKPKPVGQSREFGIGQPVVFSPEVLKKVKDPLMLDKYIDHLHQRRTRRAGTKSAQKRESVRKARGGHELAEDGLDFREVRLGAIHRAKQELRDVFLRPSSVIDDPFLNLLDESSDGKDHDNEEDDDSVNSQIDL